MPTKEEYMRMPSDLALNLALSEIEQLRWKIAQLEKENGALRMMLKDTDTIRQSEMR